VQTGDERSITTETELVKTHMRKDVQKRTRASASSLDPTKAARFTALTVAGDEMPFR
jgi:hypothetical protein